MFKVWDTMLHILTTLFLTYVVSSLVFIHLRLVQFFNEPLKPSQNSRIYTEIKLHTGGFYFIIFSIPFKIMHYFVLGYCIKPK